MELKECELGNDIFKLAETNGSIMMQLLERVKELEAKVERIESAKRYEGYSSK